jgi:Integrase zinc binding domain
VFEPKQTFCACIQPFPAGSSFDSSFALVIAGGLLFPQLHIDGLIGAHHDRLCHAGISHTLAFLHQHFHWPGIKADVEAFIRQCHACQLRRLQLQDMARVGLPRMSCPFQHVHIDLAGPFQLRAEASQPRRRKQGITKIS